MPTTRPEPGMTYDFKVEGVFYMSMGYTVITGTPSIDYNLLFPATAEVWVNEKIVAHIPITGEMHARSLDPSRRHIRSLVTTDKTDLKAYLSQGMLIHGVFVNK